jgi:hypothetical protein
MELNLGVPGEDSGFDVGELLIDGSGARVDLALGNEGHAEDAASQVILREGRGETRFALAVKERFEFFGGSRKQHDQLAEGLAEDVGLSRIVGRHRHVARGETLGEGLEESIVAVELKVKSFGEALASEVVFGGAEAAGEEDDVGAVESDADGRGEVLAVVADNGLEGYGDAEVIEARGEVEGVGVLPVRRQHLGTDGDDFG